MLKSSPPLSLNARRALKALLGHKADDWSGTLDVTSMDECLAHNWVEAAEKGWRITEAGRQAWRNDQVEYPE